MELFYYTAGYANVCLHYDQQSDIEIWSKNKTSKASGYGKAMNSSSLCSFYVYFDRVSNLSFAVDQVLPF